MKKYQIIYADPPWNYKVYNCTPYRTLTVDEICKLPVDKISLPNCALFLWCTFPNLPFVFEVIKSWGFTYKTVAFVWVKKNKISDSWFWGNGYYTRSNAEICLLGIKGHLDRKAKNIHQIIDTKIQEHSRKPNIVREKIVQLFGDLPRIELFAREPVKGWDCWGNEVESDIELI